MLQSIEEAVDTLNSFTIDGFPSLSCYYPLMKGLKGNITPHSGECDLSIVIQAELNKHWISLKDMDAIQMAMLLDPRFKDRFFEQEESKDVH